MQLRKFPARQGLVWFRQAIDIGARNPRAVFGASLLLIASLYAVALVAAILAALLMGGQEAGTPHLGRMLWIAVPVFLVFMFLIPVLLGGLMHVIREAEVGRPVRARDLYAPLLTSAGRRLAILGLVQIVFAIAGGALMVALAGSDYWRDYLAAMQGAMQGSIPVVPEPQHAGLIMLVQLVFNYFSYAIMLLSIPLMLFGRASLAEALRGSLHASVRNVGAQLLAGLLFLGGLLISGLLLVLVATLVGLAGSLLHKSLGALLSMLVLLAFAAVALVVLVGGAYFVWRDTFGDAAMADATPHGIEV